MYVSSFVCAQYLVFEYVEKTLLEVLEARRGGLNPEEVCWGRQAIAMLARHPAGMQLSVCSLSGSKETGA